MKKYQLLVSSVYLLITVHLEMVSSFGASLFGNRFLFRNHRYVTKPSQAYQLREPYAQKYGPYGDNFIQTLPTHLANTSLTNNITTDSLPHEISSQQYEVPQVRSFNSIEGGIIGLLMAGKVPLYNKPQRRPKFILPTIAPFGTEGFTFSPEEEQRRKIRRYRRRQRQRRQRGHRP